MVYTVDDILKGKTKHLLNQSKGTCPHCKKEIFNRHEHEDCYWNAFSDLIEKHPIGLPGGYRST